MESKTTNTEVDENLFQVLSVDQSKDEEYEDIIVDKESKDPMMEEFAKYLMLIIEDEKDMDAQRISLIQNK
jgi:hypothetical protein